MKNPDWTQVIQIHVDTEGSEVQAGHTAEVMTRQKDSGNQNTIVQQECSVLERRTWENISTLVC